MNGLPKPILPHGATIIDGADFDRTVDLLVALIHSLDDATVARIKSFNPNNLGFRILCNQGSFRLVIHSLDEETSNNPTRRDSFHLAIRKKGGHFPAALPTPLAFFCGYLRT